MKKVLIVSIHGVGERTEFAKHFFDEINKLAALFMMYTHGVGRWPSSRTPLMDCTTTKRVTSQQCDKADYIILMHTNKTGKVTNLLTREDYQKKIQNWHIDEALNWEDQKEVIKDYVRELSIQCDDSPYVKKASKGQKIISFAEFIQCSNWGELQKLLIEL